MLTHLSFPIHTYIHSVSSTAFNKQTSLLLVGFDQGVFGLYEMPGCVSLQRLSVSNQSLNTACINSTGEWMGLGSSRLGQVSIRCSIFI